MAIESMQFINVGGRGGGGGWRGIFSLLGQHLQRGGAQLFAMSINVSKVHHTLLESKLKQIICLHATDNNDNDNDK